MSLQIRPITEADWPLIEQHYPQYLNELPTEPGDDDEAITWVRRAFERAIVGEHHFWLAYDEAAQLVGFTIFATFDNFPGATMRYGVLMDFYILPAARRQHVGRELARAAFAKMREEGANSVELNVLRENHRALAFWQSLGPHVHHFVLKMRLDDSYD